MWRFFVFMVLLFAGCAHKGMYNKSEDSCNRQLYFSEQKAYEIYRAYLRCSQEVDLSVSLINDPSQKENALSNALWTLNHSIYSEVNMEEILLLAQHGYYDSLQLEWWRSESSEERLCILMCFYHHLNPQLSAFPSFKSYSQHFREKECDSRQREIAFVEQLWREGRL